MKKLLIATILGACVGSAVAATTVIVREAPPPLRDERVPAARPGYVWAPGHWEWRHNHHVWVRGKWLRARHGYMYRAPEWTERDGRWVMSRGTWVRGHRDRDGDGVPNRFDSHPDNPRRD